MDIIALPDRDAVLAAGALLSHSIAPDCYERAASAVATAHAWRAAHLTPMHSMRQSVHGVARAVTGEPLVAGRIKRMSSIRKKLRRTSISLPSATASGEMGLGRLRLEVAEVPGCQPYEDGPVTLQGFQD